MPDDVNELGTTPAGTTPNNVPSHIQLLKNLMNTGSLVRRLTSAQIAALGAAQKPIGLLVYDTTAGDLVKWNGAAWDVLVTQSQLAALALPLAGGTMTGPIAMGGSKITGLGAASAAGDAVNKALLDVVAALAAAALPKAGGTLTGNLVMDVGTKIAGPYPATGDLTIHTPTGQVVLQGPAGTPFSGQIAHANAAYANQSATLGQVPSSRDVKQNIAPLTEQQRATFDQIDPVAFEYRPGQGPNEVEQDGIHLGFIAEDVRDAGLRIVEDPDGGVVALQPVELIAVLWAKVQDLEARLEAAQR